jgi:type I restriction enzyme S subunit
MTVGNIQTHEHYKDSGVDWLGEIPGHWQIKPGLVALSENKRDNKGMKETQVLSLSYGNIIVKPEEKLTGLVPESFETYQVVEPGDIIIRGTDLQNDQTSLRTGLAKDRGIITSAYIGLRVRSGFNPSFVHYYLHALDTCKILYKFGSGLRQNLGFEDFKRLPIAEVPTDEQDAIVRFLDEKTAKIDAAIELEERQIALLKERKQIVIQNAVTKGLNPGTPMKESGVDWIGEIPAHWGVFPLFSKTRIKSVSNCADRDLLSVYLDLGVVKFSDIDEKRTNATSLDLSAYQAVDPGDFVLNNQQAWRGSVGVSMHAGIVSPAYIVLSLSPDFDPAFANYYFRSPALVSHYLIGSKGVGTIQRNLYWPKLRTTPISIPPIGEQIEIVAYIRAEAGKIDRAISLKNDQIAALREYKATLINSAVTGKIKVA